MTSANNPATPTPSYDLVGTGATFACGRSAGAVSCWGDNSFDQDDQAYLTPMFTKPIATGIQASGGFALGSNHGCAANGMNLTCWGDNDSHQASATDAAVVLGSSASLPAAIGATTAGAHHTCVLLNESTVDAGNVFCVGDNSYGQLGNAGTPVTTFTMNGVTTHMNSLAAGYEHTCSVSFLENRAYCWGDNSAGQLGDGTITQRSSPVFVVW